MKLIIIIFALIGLSVTIAFIGVLLCDFKKWICDKIEDKKWKEKYEHRFDKPPIAKCYCYDCRFYNKDSCRCNGYGYADIYTPDNGFCYKSEPHKSSTKT